MPLYEYQCDGKCKQRFELIRKFSDPPVEKCPNCGGKVHKLMSSPAIQFKGSGWYITDYAKKDSTAAGKSDPGTSSSDSKETKSSDNADKTDKADKPAEKKSGDASPAGASTPKPSKKP